MRVVEEQKRKIAAILIGQGVPKKDVAKTVGVHVNTITNWCKEDDFQDACNKASDNIIEGIVTAGQAATSLALTVIIELLGCRNKNLAFKAAQDILDRFGLPKGMKQEVVANVGLKGYVNFDPDDWPDEESEGD
ncbi:MAG: hypothetical protein PVJ86_00405 [Phycisphaerales bacterium]|jgi:uncharacterized protein YjcR